MFSKANLFLYALVLRNERTSLMRSKLFQSVKSGFNEFAERMKSPHFKASLRAELRMIYCDASIWIVNLLEGGAHLTMH